MNEVNEVIENTRDPVIVSVTCSFTAIGKLSEADKIMLREHLRWFIATKIYGFSAVGYWELHRADWETIDIKFSDEVK